MIKASELKKVIAETDIQCDDVSFDQVDTIQTPYMVTYDNGVSNFGADGNIYFQTINKSIELIDVINVTTNELKLEKVLLKHGVIFSKDISYIQNENVKSVEYTFEVQNDLL